MKTVMRNQNRRLTTIPKLYSWVIDGDRARESVVPIIRGEGTPLESQSFSRLVTEEYQW